MEEGSSISPSTGPTFAAVGDDVLAEELSFFFAIFEVVPRKAVTLHSVVHSSSTLTVK